MGPKKQRPDSLGHLTFKEAESLATDAFVRAGVRTTEAEAAANIVTLAEAMGIKPELMSGLCLLAGR